MCISCWLSYVCSSVLAGIAPDRLVFPRHGLTLFLCDQFILVHYWALGTWLTSPVFKEMASVPTVTIRTAAAGAPLGDRTSVVAGKRGSVSVETGSWRPTQTEKNSRYIKSVKTT